MKKRAEDADGEILGEGYIPPGRTAVFDIPAYDDIADLHELFKRFANTAAGVTEAGLGGMVDKTADFTVTTADLGKTFVCSNPDLLNITVGAASTFSEGARFNVVQAGTGKAQVNGSDVIGSFRTTGQYEGLTAVVHGGKWWCLPFGSSSGGGGGGGPIPIINTAADLTIVDGNAGQLIACNTTTKDINITVPADDGTIPIGSVVVVSNVGGGAFKVRLIADAGVTLQDRANATISRYQSAALVKRAANIWLINAGGGSGGGSVPTVPQNAKGFGLAGGLLVAWEPPADDGGHSITSYIVEYGEAADALTKQKIVTGDQVSASIYDLTVGKTYYAHVKAVNSVGSSEPTAVVSGVPTQEYNDASGGDEVKTYLKDGRYFRYHKFTKTGTLTVAKGPNPFRILVVGAGGGGASGDNNTDASHRGGAAGAGGVSLQDSAVVFTPGTYPAVIGDGGRGATSAPGAGSAGGKSAIGTHEAAGGAGGQQFVTPPQRKITSDITGVNADYAITVGYGVHNQPEPGSSDGGVDRGGAGNYYGTAGVVIVAYEISPTADPIKLNHTGKRAWQISNYDASQVYTVISGPASVSGTGAVTLSSDGIVQLNVSKFAGGPAQSIWFQSRQITTHQESREQSCGGCNCRTDVNPHTWDCGCTCGQCWCTNDGRGQWGDCTCRGTVTVDVDDATPAGFDKWGSGTGGEWFRQSYSPLALDLTRYLDTQLVAVEDGALVLRIPMGSYEAFDFSNFLARPVGSTFVRLLSEGKTVAVFAQEIETEWFAFEYYEPEMRVDLVGRIPDLSWAQGLSEVSWEVWAQTPHLGRDMTPVLLPRHSGKVVL